MNAIELTLEVSVPRHIPHNVPVIQRDLLNVGFHHYPRYRAYQTSNSATWEIVDRETKDKYGRSCIRSTFRSKSTWSPEDIYTFLKHLNSRQ